MSYKTNAATLINAAGTINALHQPAYIREAADVLLAGAARIEELELALANAAMRLTLVISRDQHKLLDVVTRDEALVLLVPR